MCENVPGCWIKVTGAREQRASHEQSIGPNRFGGVGMWPEGGIEKLNVTTILKRKALSAKKCFQIFTEKLHVPFSLEQV